ncbi:MAG: ABC transporter permease subunit [Clostridia bacterium]|nr:ABC transporter permease subunit [Clostridia bacterium]
MTHAEHVNKPSRKKIVRLTVRHIVLALLAAFWLIPILWLVLNAFSVDKGPNLSHFFPQAFTLDHFRNILLPGGDSVNQFPRWFLNTLIVGCFNCVISSAFVLMVAYAMSCMRFKARKPMMNVAIILNLFPGFLSMIVVYFILKEFGLTNSLTGLVIVYSAGSGMGYLIAKGFFDTISKSLREAAWIEGANEFTVFWKIILPLAKPIIVYTVINAFLAPWMDFVMASLMLNSGVSSGKTVALGLFAMVDKVNRNNYFGEFCAGGVVVSIPISILFVIMQKFYVEGITGGSVKG